MGQTVTTLIKNATWATYHEPLEASAYHQALLDKSLPLAAYVGFLRSLTALSDILERSLDTSPEPTIRAIWHRSHRKLPWLQQDLVALRYRLIPDQHHAMTITLQQVASLRILAKDNPLTLLGYFFVLEGSTQGARYLYPKLADHFYLCKESGLAYFHHCAHTPVSEWQAVKERFDAVCLDEREQQSVVEGAMACFQFIGALFNSLYPQDTATQGFYSYTLNPQSGNYPIATDATVLRAALQATDRCLAEFPYFTQRYGCTGFLYGDSDGAWLASLVTLKAAEREKQLDWMARLLATRGMPSFLLVRHIQILCDQLDHTVPEHTELWNLLRSDAAHLHHKVTQKAPALLEQAAVWRVHAGFDDATTAKEATLLLAAAYLDECYGYSGCYQSVKSWFVRVDYFAASWLTSLERFCALLEQVALPNAGQ